ncbi:MAG: hypothetical protein K5872_06295 [Rhizobiaceae bacterium]|nr:hypothetical protein [Rhizobiaceae bacterium]MCV0405824.1 hypothetical protein [Rhizobiaceae bacterium]
MSFDRRLLLTGMAATLAGGGITMSDADAAPGFDARIALSDKALSIAYRVTNTGGKPIFVTNKLHRAGARPVIDQDHVYSWLEGNGRLVVAKIMPVIPRDRSPTNLVAPYMTRLDPGRAVEESLSLPVPVRPYLEYHDNTPLAEDVAASSVEFRLGWFLPPDGAAMVSDTAFGHKVDNFRNPPGRQARYSELRSAAVGLQVPVRRTRAMDRG